MCPLEKFLEITSNKIIGNFEQECSMKNRITSKMSNKRDGSL